MNREATTHRRNAGARSRPPAARAARRISVQSREICRMCGQLGNGQPLIDALLGRPYESPDLACWRLTDQADEKPGTPAVPVSGK